MTHQPVYATAPYEHMERQRFPEALRCLTSDWSGRGMDKVARNVVGARAAQPVR
jgi:hypothetical protein